MVGKPSVLIGSNVSYDENSNLFTINNGTNKSREIVINITFRANKVGDTRISVTGMEGTIENGLMRVPDVSRRITIKEEVIATPSLKPTSNPTPTTAPTEIPTIKPTERPTIKPTIKPTTVPTNNPTPTENSVKDRPNNNGTSQGTNGNYTNKAKPTQRPINVSLVPSRTPVQTALEPETTKTEEVPTLKPEVVEDKKTPEENYYYTEVKSVVKLSNASDIAKKQMAVNVLVVIAIVFLIIIVILISYTKIKISRVKKLTSGRNDVPANK